MFYTFFKKNTYFSHSSENGGPEIEMKQLYLFLILKNECLIYWMIIFKWNYYHENVKSSGKAEFGGKC